MSWQEMLHANKNCPYSYAEAGGSSLRSRETDFDSTPPPPPPIPPNHKVKFLVSYGGRIQPRHHDTHLSYVGGETKILYVDRSISFSALISKLSSLIDDSLSSFKYQLPGEDLDALISVSNEDDLQHLMHEYDRLYRASPKPVRFRLFLFPGQSSRFGSGSSDQDPDRFVEAFNLGSSPAPASGAASANMVDFLFGLDSRGPVQTDKLIGSDPQIEARIQELNQLKISGPKSDAVEWYQKPTPSPVIPSSPASYWQPAAVRLEHHPQQRQPVYVVHAPQPASVYHAPQPVVRPSPTQGYYHQVQRVPSEPVYREHPVYTMAAGAAPAKVVAGYSEVTGPPVRPVAGLSETSGRQVYYASPGGVGVGTTSFQEAAAVVVSGNMRARPAGGLARVDGKIVTKI
ncbi:hypothetical protein Cgig2_019473 [Carnegiea gigantea]|uniref:PB1 domain-containing protein n=1 Tax=Carnegiea gigantea TaxID=171969 RepID=A0A9Q1QMQ2_9CARY|nr:hypothetical protein Cgig2_019473 [Carnegiea gigantea]